MLKKTKVDLLYLSYFVTVALLVLCLNTSCSAGRFQEAPIYHYGTYLQQCDYEKYSVCCNYNDAQTMCSARLCTGMWMTDGWEVVFEHCPGDTPQIESLPVGHEAL